MAQAIKGSRTSDRYVVEGWEGVPSVLELKEEGKDFRA